MSSPSWFSIYQNMKWPGSHAPSIAIPIIAAESVSILFIGMKIEFFNGQISFRRLFVSVGTGLPAGVRDSAAACITPRGYGLLSLFPRTIGVNSGLKELLFS